MGDLKHGLRFKTPRSAEIFEKWLNDNCGGEAELVVEDFSVGTSDKKLAVFFEIQSDLQAFKEAYRTI
tara:strand:+ start:2271 stop:2474 length:204 start_codon:yes stop_codon:yes gene_type:complete